MHRIAIAGAALLALGTAPPPERQWQLPDRHNPWALLSVSEAPGWLTRHKLRRIAERPAECRASLATATLDARALPDRDTGTGCAIRNAVLVRESAFLIDPPLTLSCRAAVSLALWERHVVLPEARRILGAPVRRLEHFGSYACRNVNNRDTAATATATASGRRSQHASADAIDVAGFVLDGGRRISVARDWQGAGADARFLHAVHAGGCEFFDAAFGPDYNRAHADHLHFDRGPYRLCR